MDVIEGRVTNPEDLFISQEEVNHIHLEELTKYTAKALPLQEILSRIEAGAI